MQLLLATGTNVNAVDEDGKTTLCVAACSGCCEAVRCLLEHGAQVRRLQCGARGYSRVEGAGMVGVRKSRKGHGKHVQVFPESGASVADDLSARRVTMHSMAAGAYAMPRRS